MNQQQLQEFINKTAQSGSILGMESIVHLCEELGNPQNQTKIIHVAGTNGKGSTSVLLQSVLISLGKKVGRYSSPAVFAYEEMFQIQGKNIGKERLGQLYATVKRACDRMVEKGYPHPTIFEVETAAAYTYFAEEECDIAIIEVGMGGRTDATNVVSQPVVSVITSISMDHTAFLGDTLEKIAYMKAGIIKKNCPVVALKQKQDVEKVLHQEAEEQNAVLYTADPKGVGVQAFTADGMKLCMEDGVCIETTLTGYTQIENISLSYKVLQVLAENGIIDRNTERMIQGYKAAVWPGRFETIGIDPRFIIDGAHNKDAAEKLAENMKVFFPNKKIHYIMGVLRDKDYSGMLEAVLANAENVYCLTPDNPRALEASELALEAEKYTKRVFVCKSAKEAVLRALEASDKDDVILAFGSLSYLSQVREAVKRRELSR